MAVTAPPCDLWLCDLSHTKQTIASNTIPLAIGSIAAYAKKQLGEWLNIRLFKYPEKLIEQLLIKAPQIIGFSNYVWNLDLSYEIARNIKAHHPKTLVVFGGPNYPRYSQEREDFLKKRSSIDFYLYREGESGLLALLKALRANNFDIQATQKSYLPNCHFLVDGKLRAENSELRLDLQEIPSPYTTGLLDEFFDGKLMPLVQTNRGCPFSCVFCTESDRFFNKVSFRNSQEVRAELEYIARHIQGTKNIFIADSNFGMYKQDLQIAEDIARIKKSYDFPDYIHVATGKNVKERVLEAAQITGGLFRLSASVQSTDPTVLKNIRRQNISQEIIIELAKTAAQVGSNTYAEVILALPGDTKAAHFKSIADVINARLNYIRCFTLMLLQGTELDSPETIEKYGLVVKYRVLPRCYGVYDFGADKVLSVETEKVCVANNTLSFEDYLECRLFALTIEIFYNDGILSELLVFLGQYGISPYEFLINIHEKRSELPNALADLYQEFRQETIDELWDSEEELLKFAKNEKIIQKFIDGELGSNLIFKYKAISFLKLMEQIHEVAFQIAADIVMKKRFEAANLALPYLEELRRYSLYKKADLLETGNIYEDSFRFDLIGAEASNFEVEPSNLELKQPVTLKFYHNDQQKEVIDGHRQEYGLSLVGISRILSRIHIKKMYRKVARL